MDSILQREPRVVWSFWITCGLAATGGIAPLLLASGGTNRLAGAVIPFGIAAVAMAVNALTYERGRPLATALYFLAGIALVYGMLSMVAVPLRLAVLGTCSAPPAPCPAGFERPFTSGEGAGFAFGIAMGTLAILVGFFGLLMLFRIRPKHAAPPPVRKDAEMAETAPALKEVPEPAALSKAESKPIPPPLPEPGPSTAASSPDAAVTAPAPPPKPPTKPRTRRAPKPQAELPPPVEPPDLPAPVEPLELPAPVEPHELPASSEPSEDNPSSA